MTKAITISMKSNMVVKLAIISVMAYIFTSSCANTTTPPMGGPKDTIPPVIMGVTPDSGALNFPLQGKEIKIEFNEYVVIKEEQKNIFLSPPQNKAPETKIKGKSIIVTLEEPLDSSTTYTINFGNAIADNNEGNIFPSYTYPFSTGSYADSIYISGNVSHAETLLPAENVTIAFYKDKADSNVFKVNPVAMAKTDKFGYFVVRNIQQKLYYAFAFSDLNYNNRYDPANEKIAFLSDPIEPKNVLRDDLPEIQYLEEDDTLKALKRPVELSLYLFKEENEKQYIVESKRLQPKMVYIKFSAANARIQSINFKNIDSSYIVQENNIKRDSIVYWIKDTSFIPPDSLKFEISFMKTDSLDSLIPAIEEFSLPLPREHKTSGQSDNADKQDNTPGVKKEEKRPDLLEFKVDVSPETIEQDGFRLIFEAPLSKIVYDSLSLTYTTSKGETGIMDYNAEPDSLWSRIIRFMPKGKKLISGEEYSLNVLPGAFTDIYKNYNDSLEKTVSIPQNERLSKLTLEIFDVKGDYIVELTNMTRDKIFRSFRINSDTTLAFPYLKSGQYSIKITEDINGNGITDTGSLKQKKQPERVRLFSLPDGTTIINIQESIELIQSFSINDVFENE